VQIAKLIAGDLVSKTGRVPRVPVGVGFVPSKDLINPLTTEMLMLGQNPGGDLLAGVGVRQDSSTDGDGGKKYSET
jgi:hypothetical protein